MKLENQEAFFERKYTAKPDGEYIQKEGDPWDYHNSEYEQNKYNHLVASLGGRRFQNAFEPGCSIGVLSNKLAPWCDKLLCTDIAPTAVKQAKAFLKPHPHVTVKKAMVPVDWPKKKNSFDLIVLSDLLAHFNHADIKQIADLTLESLIPGGGVLAMVNYNKDGTGEKVSNVFLKRILHRMEIKKHEAKKFYLLDVLTKK